MDFIKLTVLSQSIKFPYQEKNRAF